MLRHVALRSPHGLDNVLDARFLLAEDAKNLQPQGVRDGPHGMRHALDLLPAADKLEDIPGGTRSVLLSNFHALIIKCFLAQRYCSAMTWS